MALFRKKPVVIEAFLFTGSNAAEVAFWIGARDTERRHRPVVTDEGIIIPTLEGQHIASPGDWIIMGVAGEFYPCKPAIFAATYESA